MSCKQVRTDIALWVGNDLEDGDDLRVERHLADCPPCREYAQEMKSSLQVLQEPEVPDVVGSLWPRISARIATLENNRRLERFNGWLPAVAVVAASVAIIVLLESRQPAAPEFVQPPAIFVDSPSETHPGRAVPRVNSLQWTPDAERPHNWAGVPRDWMQPLPHRDSGGSQPDPRFIFR